MHRSDARGGLLIRLLRPFLLAGAVGCSYQSGGRIDEAALTTWTGSGAAMSVVAGARVHAEDGRIRTDTADGGRWYDIRWLRAPEVTEAYVHQWSFDTCDTARYDRPATPVPGTTTMAGTCMIDWRRHWIFAVLETHGEDTLVTMYVADSKRVTMEDAWVDLTRTALTLTAGEAPLRPMPADEVRRIARDAVKAGRLGQDPVPGGGELSAAISEELDPVWEARRAAPPPRF